MASSIPAAQAALLAALRASVDAAFAGAEIIDIGEWAELTGDADRVTVTTARDIAREWAALGPALRLEETFLLQVEIEVRHAGDDATAAKARMWELVTAVETTVLSDIRLGGAVRTCRPAGAPAGEAVGPISDSHVGAAITLRLACEQRVQLQP